MDRRQFGRLAAALFIGKVTAERVVRDDVLLLTGARTNVYDGPSGNFNNATWRDPGGFIVPQEFAFAWPPGVITDEMLDDALVARTRHA